MKMNKIRIAVVQPDSSVIVRGPFLSDTDIESILETKYNSYEAAQNINPDDLNLIHLVDDGYILYYKSEQEFLVDVLNEKPYSTDYSYWFSKSWSKFIILR